MSKLVEYRRKRDFAKTPEPRGAAGTRKPLLYVVQKHEATRLHYDFRLEHRGVLLSWAVPKGPTLKLGEKHLAMMVEDHPVSYMKFEGTIPEGNYGAGTVMVWDFCNYLALGAKNLAESEKMIKKGLKDGMLKFVVNGQKIQGGFALIKTNFAGKHSWLLIKERDEYAKNIDVTKKDKSALSGKSMAQI